MKYIHAIALFIGVLWMGHSSYAQSITGQVTDENGEGLPAPPWLKKERPTERLLT